MRILLLDDDSQHATQLAALLENSAYVSRIESGFPADLLELLTQNNYDILLITLPDDTARITEALYINRSTANIPAVLITRTNENMLNKELSDAGITAVVSSNEPEQLVPVLQQYHREVLLKRKLEDTERELALVKVQLEAEKKQPLAQSPVATDFSKLVFASLSESIAAIDDKGTILYTNQSWKNFAKENGAPTLVTAEGKNYLDACSKAAQAGDESAAAALTGILAVIDHKQPYFELEYPCHSDTQRRWFMMCVTPFQDKQPGALITHLNITDKKNKDLELEFSYKELLSSEKINQALVNSDSIENLAEYMLLSLYETAGVQRSRIYLYNKSANKLELYAQRIPGEIVRKIEKRTGFKIDSMVPELFEGSPFNDVIQHQKIIFTHDHQEIRGLVAEHSSNWFIKKLAGWAQKLVGIKTFGLFPLKKGDEVIGVLSITTPLVLNEREKKTVFRFAQHASLALSRRLDQQKLEQSEEKFRAISNFTANWETWFDTEGKPIWINPGVYNHIGYTAEELLAMPDFYDKLVYPEDYPIVMTAMHDSLSNRRDGENLEFRCCRKEGSVIWLSVSWKHVFDKDGKWIGVRSSAIDITERKNHQLELIRKKNELKEVHEIARLGSWEWNTVNGQVTLSDYVCQALEISADNATQSLQELLNMIAPESRTVLEQTISSHSKNFKPGTEIELQVNTDSGTKKYFLVRANLASESTASKTIIRGSALDISELRETYDQARKHQDRFRKIFESIQDVYYQTNLEGMITLVSPSVYHLLGYHPEEVIGQPISMLYVKPRLHELRMARRHLMGDKEQFEASLMAKNGDEIFVSINLNFLNGADSNHRFVQGMIRNITEKKKQEKSLENQRKRLLEIVKLNTQIIQTSDHFYYVVQITDTKTRSQQLKYVSTPVTAILGLTELDLLNREDRWQSLIHPEDKGALQQAIDRVFKFKKPERVSYRIYHNRSQEIIWLDDYICPLLNGNDDVVEIYGSVKDVSERINLIHKIESEKKQSVAYQYQLLSSQLNPHFIYNTLNTFQYYILQGNIEESLNHISDFSKLMRKVLENSMYNYITLDEEIEFLQHYMRISRQRMKQPLEFSIDVDDTLETGDVMIPPMLLQPYLENAMIHGFHECPHKPVLRLAIHKHGDVIECVIEDNGIGRKKSIQNKGNRLAETKRSYAMGINKNRIDLLNQVTEQKFEVVIEDLYDESRQAAGTRVFIRYREIINDL